jgi:hypothetical protein
MMADRESQGPSAEVIGLLSSPLNAYLAAMEFIVSDTARDPSFCANHLLFYLADDFLQSAVSIIALARVGALSVAKRELRFIIESSIKMCYVQQKRYDSSIQDKLMEFDKELSSPSISIKRDLRLQMLPSILQEQFSEEIGRLYGRMSGYVHLTPVQILERIAAVDAGRSVGYEANANVEELNRFVSRGLAASLVLLFHSAPEYVAGDWLVNPDGTTMTSYFSASQYIAGIDSYFDYKQERQTNLEAVQTARANRIAF